MNTMNANETDIHAVSEKIEVGTILSSLQEGFNIFPINYNFTIRAV